MINLKACPVKDLTPAILLSFQVSRYDYKIYIVNAHDKILIIYNNQSLIFLFDKYEKLINETLTRHGILTD